ncbi:MAG: ATP-binding cassette domain-containing protein [Candidatus Babeliales bacterium]
MAYLAIKNLNQFYKNKQILDSISLYADLGEVIAFIGPNGAGKTTLLKTIIGLLKTPKHDPEKELNVITLQSNIINKWTIYKRVSHGILYLPQQTSLIQQMSVLDNLKLIYQYHQYWQNKNLQIFNQELELNLEQIGLTEHKKQLAVTLSGGQKRKLEVARSILMHPNVIILDEPFAGVDPKSIYELKKIFSDLAKNNIAVLISDHNVDQLLSIATRIYVIINGKIVTTGGVKDIINNQYTKEMYLGKQFYSEISKRFL